MTGYIVHAEWDATGWWVATVPAVPGAITQCKRLDQVRTDIAEAIEIQTGVAPDSTSITVEWRVPGEAGNAAERARQLQLGLCHARPIPDRQPAAGDIGRDTRALRQ